MRAPIKRTAFTLYEHLSGYQYEKRRFKDRVGYELNLANPRSLNEKMEWKKLFDRDPLLVTTSDKYLGRRYIAAILGQEAAKEMLFPLLHVTETPNTIPFDTFPEEYILKANHASGWNRIVDQSNPAHHEQIIAECTAWLNEPYGFYKHEWAYKKVSRKIVIEKLMRDEEGYLPTDYKFHIFHGTCKFIHTTNKKSASRRRVLFTPDWQMLDVGWKHPKGEYVEPPRQLKTMIPLAEKLGAPFDYVRVDLYNIGERIYCGELTHYHGSGSEKFYPEHFDFDFGAYWNLTPHYWKKRTPISISTS